LLFERSVIPKWAVFGLLRTIPLTASLLPALHASQLGPNRSSHVYASFSFWNHRK
jgi:hypothetical protein